MMLVDCPTNIKTTDDLALLTAQQWKNFTSIYARPCFVGLLSVRAYKCICLLCNITQWFKNRGHVDISKMR